MKIGVWKKNKEIVKRRRTDRIESKDRGRDDRMD